MSNQPVKKTIIPELKIFIQAKFANIGVKKNSQFNNKTNKATAVVIIVWYTTDY